MSVRDDEMWFKVGGQTKLMMLHMTRCNKYIGKSQLKWLEKAE